jgi:hypothetical protein
MRQPTNDRFAHSEPANFFPIDSHDDVPPRQLSLPSGGGGFGVIVSNIRNGLDREQDRIRQRTYELRQHRHDQTQQLHDDYFLHAVDGERQSLIDRLHFLENQLACNANECRRLEQEMERMRIRNKSNRATRFATNDSSGSIIRPISLHAYR